VTISVGTMLQRIEELRGTHNDTLKLLARRGLTTTEIGNAKKMIEQVGSIRDKPAIDPEAQRRQIEEKRDKFWGWYLEWSAVARATIESGRWLRQMGFGRDGDAVIEEEETEVEGKDIGAQG